MRKPIRVALLAGVGLFGSITVEFLTAIAPIWIWPTAAFICLFGVALTYVPEIKLWLRRCGIGTTAHAVAADPVRFHFSTSEPTVTVTRASFWTRIKRLLFRQSPFPGGTTDEEAVRRNPGNGRRMIRLIMNASTVDEVADRYSDFASAPHRTMELDVFAACAVKKIRFLNGDDEVESGMWWKFSGSAAKEFGLNEAADEFFAAAERLDKEYPATQPMTEQ